MLPHDSRAVHSISPPATEGKTGGWSFDSCCKKTRQSDVISKSFHTFTCISKERQSLDVFAFMQIQKMCLGSGALYVQSYL